MKRCHGRLHYDKKFQIFIFLIGYINVNKGVFCLIISYLRIKGYNVLNYNNCSTDWSFPLNCRIFIKILFFDVFLHFDYRHQKCISQRKNDKSHYNDYIFAISRTEGVTIQRFLLWLKSNSPLGVYIGDKVLSPQPTHNLQPHVKITYRNQAIIAKAEGVRYLR